MNRIETMFKRFRNERRKALMPFVTAGYPSLEAAAAMLPAIERAGAGVCELGVPFSDPIADGPTIQASMGDALAAGVHPADILAMVEQLRPQLTMGLVAMVSYSLVYRGGAAAFIKRSAEAGIDGLIVPDLPLEEAEAVTAPAREAGLTCSLLIAPTTPDERAAAIARACSGFVYMVARTGITGERDTAPADLSQRVRMLRRVTDLPIAVGFGVSTAEHVRSVTQAADAAIVGSALVKRIMQHKDANPEQLAGHIERFVGELAGGLTD